MSEHTIGPWKAFTDEFMNEDEIPVRAGEAIVCCVWPMGDDDVGINERSANAHLIAAAPDLLAACEAFAEWDCTLASLDVPSSVANLIRAAIAKARGQ